MAQGGAQVQTHHTWSGARLGQLLLPRRVRVLAAGKRYKVVCFERESPAILACKKKVGVCSTVDGRGVRLPNPLKQHG